MARRLTRQRAILVHTPSVAQTLPNELLSIIFQLCAEVDVRPDLCDVLCRVCLSWARNFLDTKSNTYICTYVRMICSGPNPSHGLAQAILKRSEGRPITLEVQADRNLTPVEIRLISRAAPSVRRFIMDPRNYYLTAWLWKDLCFSFRNLQEYEYRVSGDLRMKFSRTLGNVLKYYLLPMVTRHEEILWERWRFENVTCITMKHMLPGLCPSISELGQMLSQCTQTLVRFEYQGICPSNEEDSLIWNAQRQLILFWKLEVVEIGFVDDIMPLARMFAGGRAPHLKSLTLRNLVHCPESITERSYTFTPQMTRTEQLFGAFIWQDGSRYGFSFPELEALHLYGIDENCDPRLINAFIHGSPLLRSLTLFAIWSHNVTPRSPTYDSLFEYADEIPDTPPAFPLLEELTVSQGHYALRRWLKRRMLAGYPPLKKLVITTSCYMAYEQVEDALETTLVQTARDVVVITDPSWCEYTHVDMERVLAKDGKLVEGFSLVSY